MKAVSILFSALLALSVFPAHAEPVMPRAITVQGEGKVKIAPDKATVNVTAYTEDKNLSEAKKLNDEKVKKLLNIAKEAGVADNDIKTLYANVEPKYRYVQESGKQIMEGYIVSNSVELTLNDIEKLSTVMKQLVDGGFDRINGIQFDLKDRETVEQEALLKAVDQAHAKADKVAGRINSKLGEVLFVQESGASFSPPPMPMMAMREQAAFAKDTSAGSNVTPAGLIEVIQSVTVSYSIQ